MAAKQIKTLLRNEALLQFLILYSHLYNKIKEAILNSNNKCIEAVHI